MRFESRYGFPIIRASDIHSALDALGLRPWKLLEEISIEEYMERAPAPLRQAELHYLPRYRAAIFETPTGEARTYFRTPGMRYADVFAVLPGDLVPLAVSFRQGAERFILVTPGGRIEADETVEQAAMREFAEETGIRLERVTVLNRHGLAVNAQPSGQLDFPCLGFPQLPVVVDPQKLDRGEFVQVVLVPVSECLTLLEQREGGATVAITVTLALRALGRLTVH